MNNSISEKNLDTLEHQLTAFFNNVKLVKQVLIAAQNKRIEPTRRVLFLCEEATRQSLCQLNAELTAFSNLHGVNVRSQALENPFGIITPCVLPDAAWTNCHVANLLKQINHVWNEAAGHCKKLDELLIEVD